MALQSYEDASATKDPPKGPDTALPAYRYAKTLVTAAKGAIEGRTKNFKQLWDRYQGRYNWTSPTSGGARALASWCFQGVVNWTFSAINTKASMILGASADIYVDSLDQESTYYDRLLVKSAVDHLLKTVRFNDLKRDAYMSGSVTGVGITMWQYRADHITGEWKLVGVPIRSDEFFPDPSVDSPNHPDCRFVVWSTDMQMSRVREIFMGKSKDVKANLSNVQEPGSMAYTVPGDSNLIEGHGQILDPQKGNAATRKAKVNFIWVKDESMIEELREVMVSEAEPGLWCADCAQTFAMDAVESDICPTCGNPMENVTIPPKMRSDVTIRRAYPYGRLIVTSGDTLLFDGQNPCQLEGCFPFAVYHHYRIPGEYLGANDVELLDSLQDAQNRTVGQIIDSTRLSLNGVFIYPVSCKSFTAMGVAPAERHPCPDNLPWQPHFVSPDSTNLGLAQLALGAIKEQFIVVSGLGGPSLSEVSSPPISATEAEIANARLSDRMKQHAREFATYCSDFAEIGRQLAVQFYGDMEMNVPVTMPNSTVKDVMVEWSNLPNVRVRVSVSSQESIKDKQVGQNITIGMQSGILDSPYAKLYLELVGASPNQIKEVMDNKALETELRGGAPPPLPGPGLIEGGQEGVPNDQAA
jgi:hypothetical protein